MRKKEPPVLVNEASNHDLAGEGEEAAERGLVFFQRNLVLFAKQRFLFLLPAVSLSKCQSSVVLDFFKA